MAINPKKVTKDKLIEMLTEERGKREALETAENVLRTKLKKADERYEALAMEQDKRSAEYRSWKARSKPGKTARWISGGRLMSSGTSILSSATKLRLCASTRGKTFGSGSKGGFLECGGTYR